MILSESIILDFKSKGSDNLGAKAMKGLCELMDSHTGSVCALDDFNTIPGAITESIMGAISPDKQFLVHNQLTFFGSFFDTITPRPGEEWKFLSEI